MDETGTPTPQSGNRMMLIIIGVVLLLLVGGGIVFFAIQQNNQTPQPAVNQTTTTQETPAATEPTTMPETTSEASETVKSFTVTASSFAFAPKQITVNQGDRVRITVTNSGGTHNFTIDELNVATKRMQTGQSETIEFVADKAGTYEFYCSVGSHRLMGMRGSLIVQ